MTWAILKSRVKLNGSTSVIRSQWELEASHQLSHNISLIKNKSSFLSITKRTLAQKGLVVCLRTHNQKQAVLRTFIQDLDSLTQNFFLLYQLPSWFSSLSSSHKLIKSWHCRTWLCFMILREKNNLMSNYYFKIIINWLKVTYKPLLSWPKTFNLS